ncbi:MAG: zf-HC2 domain-containing protein [Thermoanaerobaculia bacterium]
MNCDQAIELLPWLLNDTLEAGERQEVRRHLETCSRCREALADTRESWRILDQHLPTETLVALAWGETPPDLDPALAERHLVSCPPCAAELEMVKTSRRLEEDDKIALFPARPRRQPQETGAYRGWRATALAASLAGLVAVSGWVYSARDARQLADRLRLVAPPAAGAQIAQAVTFLNVSPDQAVERGKAREVTKLPASSSPPVLALVSSGTGVYDQYQIEIRDPRGALVSTVRGIQKDPNGFYPVLLPRGALMPGTYTLHVFGVAGNRREPLETYTVEKRQAA